MPDRQQLQTELKDLMTILRERYADAVLSTRVTHCDERAIIAHASIVTGTGLSSSGIGSAVTDDGAAEHAENRAITRALIALGIDPEAVNEPLPEVVAAEHPGRVVPFPTPDIEPAGEEEEAQPAAPTGNQASAPAEERRAPEPPARSTRPVAVSSGATSNGTASAPEDDNPEAADLSWTAFWRWAREHGYSNKLDLEAALKSHINGLTPGEIRRRMRAELHLP